MSCTPGSAKQTNLDEGNSGFPPPSKPARPKPKLTGELATTDSAWEKGYLMNLREGQMSEMERLPDGDWRVNLVSNVGPAFVIIHDDRTINRCLAILFDEEGLRVARMTADADSPEQALENLRQIAAYEDSVAWNLRMEEFRQRTQEKREATRRKKIIEKAEAVRYTDGKNGKELIDERLAEGCTKLVETRLKSGKSVVQKSWYLQNPDNPVLSYPIDDKALLNYARLALSDREFKIESAPVEPVDLVMYPESMDHDAVARALAFGRSVPDELLVRYPDLVERYGIGM